MVDVAAFGDGDIVGEKLERNDGQEGHKAVAGVRNDEAVVAHVLDDGIVLGDHGDDFAFAGFYFLDVADNFFVHAMLGCDDDDGHFLVDEGDGTVFHFGGGIAFGMDVGYFFQFESAFECNGVVVATAKVDEVFAVGEHLGELVDVFVVFECPLHFVGDCLEFFDKCVEHFFGEGFPFFGDG